MRQFLAKHNHLYGQMLLLLALNLLSGFILYGNPLVQGKLYWDVLASFSLFRDNLNSLNYFGEVAWWNPKIGFGLPMYYISILGHSIYNPFFVLLAAACWLLGMANIHITSFLRFYSIYVVFIIPFFFSLAGLLLARQIFRSNLTIVAVLLFISFSPGIILNFSEDGLLLTAWSLFFAAALLSFMKAPTPSRFWALCLTILVNALSFNHMALHWSVLFMPLFLVVCMVISDIPTRQRFVRMTSSMPAWHWAAAGAAIAICLLPTVITYSHGADLVRTTSGTRWYPMEILRPGNPLEPLSISTPAIGFFWNNDSTVWKPFSYLEIPKNRMNMDFLAYTYMGLIALPLAITGLLYGRRIWRLRLLVLIGVSALVIVLSAYSPLFYLIMFWEQPLRAVNHYSDLFFRLGAFFHLVLAACLGFETLLRAGKLIGRQFMIIFALFLFWSLSLMGWIYGKSLLDTPLFGFAMLLALVYICILVGMVRETHDLTPYLKFLLVAFMALDMAMVATWHVRRFPWKMDPYANFNPDKTPGSIGLPPGDPGSYTAQMLLQTRQIMERLDAGADPSALPLLGTLNLVGNDQIANLSTGNASILQQTYNTTTIEAIVRIPQYLFWRDAYFPGWKAIVNGQPAEIMDLDGFKAVPIPQGRSEVRFVFSPGALPFALVAAYAVFAGIAVQWLRSLRSDRLIGRAV